MLKLIPISKPGVSGVSYAVVRTDVDEMTVRKNAAAQGFLSGIATQTGTNPQFWSFIETVNRR
jgi:hypothetical protein